MCIPARKFHIRRVRQGYLLVFLVFAPIVFWIFSKCFNSFLQEEEWNQIEEDESIEREPIIHDIEGNETYPIDITYFPDAIWRKHGKYLRQVYEDPMYLKKLKEMLQAYRFVTLLPHRRKDGSATILFELAKWDPDIVPLEHLKQLKFIICIQALRHPVTQASGINLIYDFADAGFLYLKYGTPQNLFLLHHVTFGIMPAKYVGYHLVNMNVIGNFMVTMSRVFLSKTIDNIFHTHSSGKALLDFFPPSMLPVQYGGNLTEYYAADWIRNANLQHGNYPEGGQKNIF